MLYKDTQSKQTKFPCPSCGWEDLSIFYELNGAPVHSVLLLPTREEAMSYPKGEIRLGFCPDCGFITNTAFDPGVHEYAGRYEATQGYSSTFNAFHRRLAQSLIDRYDLHGKSILEIGCGQGEFLALLCELGGNRGLGFDPAYSPERSIISVPEGVTFIQDFYTEKYVEYQGDFICCKMTLEHIHQTADFLHTVRNSIGDQQNSLVFFQVPNGRYVFGEMAFWDIYYEHCSYFSLGSIARLFRRSGFEVVELWTDYDDQYLMIGARPGRDNGQTRLPQENDLEQLQVEVRRFSSQYPHKLSNWRQRIESLRDAGKKIVLWGGGSKAVAFLSTLNIGLEAIEYVVDINPHKSGTYIAGMGQEIIAPEFLKNYQPNAVIVMNPVYSREIQETLEQMNLFPEVLTVHSV